MKIFSPILFVVISLVSCSQYKAEHISATKIQFFEDEVLLSDTSKEVAFVDSLSSFIVRSKAKSTSQETSGALPLNRSQYIKFLKYMNTAAQSEGQLLFVFVDRTSGKIIDFSGHEKNKTVYLTLTKSEFLEKLQAEKIEFKLIEKNILSKYNSKPTNTTTKSKDNDELVVGDVYTKYFYTATGIASVLMGASDLCTQLVWFKKIAAPGYILENPFPGVENSNTFLSAVYFGNYNQSAAGFDYNQLTKKIEGYSIGYVEIKVEYMGLVVGTKYALRAHMTVTENNEVTYQATSSLL